MPEKIAKEVGGADDAVISNGKVIRLPNGAEQIIVETADMFNFAEIVGMHVTFFDIEEKRPPRGAYDNVIRYNAGETFRDGVEDDTFFALWDVEHAGRLIAASEPEVVNIDPRKYGFVAPQLWKGQVQLANPREPGMLAQVDVKGERKFVLINGNHRYARALWDEMLFPCYLLSVTQSRTVMIQESIHIKRPVPQPASVIPIPLPLPFNVRGPEYTVPLNREDLLLIADSLDDTGTTDRPKAYLSRDRERAFRLGIALRAMADKKPSR